MRTVAGCGLVVLLAAAAFGQHRGVVNASPHPFGNVVFPGTGGPVAAPGAQFSITNPGFASQLGNTITGHPARGTAGGGLGAGRGGNRSVVYVPYAYPVYAGGYGYGYEQAQQAPIIIYQQPAPPVIINQHFGSDTARPVIADVPQDTSGVRIYDAPVRAPVDAPTENYYLIAFKDHSIYSALAYWVEGETLHYVTSQGTHNQASLDLIDQDFTKQLNRDRNVEMRLGAKK